MKNIIVLGAGMVGSVMAIDLANKHAVTLTDLDPDALAKAQTKCGTLNTQILDVTNDDLLKTTIQSFDLVVCAVPGFLGYKTLRTIITAGVNVVDISFFPENSLTLHSLAKENNVTAIVDCGVAPGMGNIILGHYNEIMQLTDFECLVGGLPKIKKWPFCYKAPFSPMDVIEEYTRPARYVENGQLVIKEALSDTELVDFEEVGTLESFNSDGLRTLIETMPHISNMKEKTLRYPGHVEYIKVLKESGFFDRDEIMIDGQAISPLQFTSRILFNEWQLGESEAEFTIMRIRMKGTTSTGQVEEITYHLYDEYCTETNSSSMARTTGYTATAAVNLILESRFNEKGVFPPELVGKHPECFEFVLDYLKDRNVIYRKTKTTTPLDEAV